MSSRTRRTMDLLRRLEARKASARQAGLRWAARGTRAWRSPTGGQHYEPIDACECGAYKDHGVYCGAHAPGGCPGAEPASGSYASYEHDKPAGVIRTHRVCDDCFQRINYLRRVAGKPVLVRDYRVLWSIPGPKSPYEEERCDFEDEDIAEALISGEATIDQVIDNT